MANLPLKGTLFDYSNLFLLIAAAAIGLPLILLGLSSSLSWILLGTAIFFAAAILVNAILRFFYSQLKPSHYFEIFALLSAAACVLPLVTLGIGPLVSWILIGTATIFVLAAGIRLVTRFSSTTSSTIASKQKEKEPEGQAKQEQVKPTETENTENKERQKKAKEPVKPPIGVAALRAQLSEKINFGSAPDRKKSNNPRNATPSNNSRPLGPSAQSHSLPKSLIEVPPAPVTKAQVLNPLPPRPSFIIPNPPPTPIPGAEDKDNKSHESFNVPSAPSSLEKKAILDLNSFAKKEPPTLQQQEKAQEKTVAGRLNNTLARNRAFLSDSAIFDSSDNLTESILGLGDPLDKDKSPNDQGSTDLDESPTSDFSEDETTSESLPETALSLSSLSSTHGENVVPPAPPLTFSGGDSICRPPTAPQLIHSSLPPSSRNPLNLSSADNKAGNKKDKDGPLVSSEILRNKRESLSKIPEKSSIPQEQQGQFSSYFLRFSPNDPNLAAYYTKQTSPPTDDLESSAAWSV